MSDDDERRAKRASDFLLEQAERAVAVRSKDREFHGLEREFMYLQAEMLVAYKKSKDVKHPRDVGDTREEILRKFLNGSRYLPERYRVSEGRARVASPTGHMTPEMDLVFYDPLDTVCLMSREGVYEVYPVETVYGVIQVKSRLNKHEIRDGLKNIAAFKKLVRRSGSPLRSEPITPPGGEHRGFGVLFAYDSDLSRPEIVGEIKEFAKQNPTRTWTNAVFILSKGCFLHGDQQRMVYANSTIETIETLVVHGVPDHQSTCLYQFYQIIMELLRNTAVSPAMVESYFHLPLIANEQSYQFVYGNFAELGECQEHGDYQRKIAPEQLTKVVEWCKQATPMNWIKVIDIAYGSPENEISYANQPGDVRVYNPECLPFSEVLLADTTLFDSATDTNYRVKGLAFDAIQSAGMTIYVPHFYSMTEGIVGGCPKCASPGPIANRRDPATPAD